MQRILQVDTFIEKEQLAGREYLIVTNAGRNYQVSASVAAAVLLAIDQGHRSVAIGSEADPKLTVIVTANIAAVEALPE
jgi:hypothetical protein